MKNYILFVFIVLALASCSNSLNKNKLFIAGVEYGRGIKKDKVPENKFDAAMSFAAKLSGKYEYISFYERDSIATLLKSENKPATPLELGKALGADQALFVRVDQFKNILRTEILSVSASDTNVRSRGEGMANLKYRNDKDEAEVYDPTILTAIQRAFAVAQHDSLMYDTIPGHLGVKPVPSLVVGGLAYSTEKKAVDWDIITRKVVTSYTAAESIFSAAKDSKDYITYDIDTRDSVYTLFKLYAVENYNFPTAAEISALKRFSIQYMVAGYINHSGDDLSIKLALFDISGNEIKRIAQEEGLLKEDSIKEFEKTIVAITKKLLKIK